MTFSKLLSWIEQILPSSFLLLLLLIPLHLQGSNVDSGGEYAAVVPCLVTYTCLVQSFVALKVLSRKEVHYGSYATSEKYLMELT
ncbi:hypothetical protein CMV_021681 [Castanea mollissima]|uniref:Uncharacterized protein n=1 Tax=Castanea mollissima TaxID=60419 RepID=A0A8J4QNK8_9ROSI|nr:hypothetical protein CMV_021681 [Castanea mollissima]